MISAAIGSGTTGSSAARLLTASNQIVPYVDSGPKSAELLRNGTLKTYEGFPHGAPTTQAETVNADLLAFLES